MDDFQMRLEYIVPGFDLIKSNRKQNKIKVKTFLSGLGFKIYQIDNSQIYFYSATPCRWIFFNIWSYTVWSMWDKRWDFIYKGRFMIWFTLKLQCFKIYPIRHN